MSRSNLNLIRRLRETPAEHIARLWKRPETVAAPSRGWLILVVVLLAIVPMLLLGLHLAAAARDLFQVYFNQMSP